MSAKRGRGKVEKGPAPSASRSPASSQRSHSSFGVKGAGHSGSVHGPLDASTIAAARDVAQRTSKESQKNPVTSTVLVNNFMGYPPHAPPTSSDNGSSQATAIQGPNQARPPGLTRGSSEESDITAELNNLQEIERLKSEVKQLRAEKVEKERLRSEVAQLKHLLEDERRKAQEKEEKLVEKVASLRKRVKDLECEGLMASKYQAATAQTRQNYSEDMQKKDDRIEELEDRLRILEEDNQRFQFLVDELRGKTKDAEDHIRYTRLQNHIAELKKSITERTIRRKTVQELLNKVEDDQQEIFYDEINSITKELKNMNARLTKLCADFENMPNPAEFIGDLGTHSRSGSYDTQYDLMPELVADMSSLASGSPPQSESVDSMEGYLLDKTYPVKQSRPDADPWAKTVEPLKGLSPRVSDRFATPAGKHRRRTGQ
ncbi:hypothetical protein N431DRAFT_545084 [Stipitochalara longipes BDJ]|nr:hypothetical protein N431DRAFT_545084 [Stipitochalara longipes BDJ]